LQKSLPAHPSCGDNINTRMVLSYSTKLAGWVCLSLVVQSVNALFADEIGQADFLQRTSGHGGAISFAHFVGDSDLLITSTASPPSLFQSLDLGKVAGQNPCFVACRNVTNGEIVWRRNVCTTQTKQNVGIAIRRDSVFTLDGSTGILQKWAATRNGELMWSVRSPSLQFNGAIAKIYAFDGVDRVFAVTSSDTSIQEERKSRNPHEEVLSMHQLADGGILSFQKKSRRSKEKESVFEISADQLLGDQDINMSTVTSEANGTARFINMNLYTIKEKKYLFIVAAYVSHSSVSTPISQIGIFQVDYDALVETGEWSVVQHWSMKDVIGRHGAAILDLSTFNLILTPDESIMGVVVKRPPARTSGVLKRDEIISFGILSSTGKPLAMTKYEWGGPTDNDSDEIEKIRVTPASNSGQLLLVHVQGVRSSSILQVGLSDGAWTVIDQRNSKVSSYTLNSYNCNLAIKNEHRIHFCLQNQVMEFTNVSGDAIDVVKEETVRRKLLSLRDDPSIQILSTSCTPVSAYITLTSKATGTTYLVNGRLGSDKFETHLAWKAEESLSNIRSTIVMDIHHVATVIDAASGGDDDILPSFHDRLIHQASSVPIISGLVKSLSSTSMVVPEDSPTSHRDFSFGFRKVIVTLTETGQLFGLDNHDKGNVIWSIDTTSSSHHHTLVYSGKDHGHHHSHPNEFLLTSQSTDQLLWKCVDGIHGKVLNEGAVDTKAKKISQIGPLRLHSSHHINEMGCRQQGVVLFSDDSVSLVPSSRMGMEAFTHLLASFPFYMHSIDHNLGRLRSVNVHLSNTSGNTCSAEEGTCSLSASITSTTLGETSFDLAKERIVSVAYPNPEEVVQRPVTILGDDSLLLKYLNPHVAVIITEATSSALEEIQTALTSVDGETSEMILALADGDSSIASSASGKKKPLGVTQPTKTGTDADSPSSSSSMLPKEAPTLFVNVVDTVAGKLLSRVSHVSSQIGRASLHNVPVVISENWVVYAYWNDKSKRTEVGVLTLHEGMIDKHGITMFKKPDQDTSFSSLESPRPIALHRTYSMSKQVLALTMSQTARGISSKQLVVALGNGQVATIDRRIIDPRRPAGEPKEAEKIEGLFRYSPILPLLPQKVASYYQPIEDVTELKSAAAHIESQTFILAYGGPDIFMARIAPSKGFDLLPENFNKSLLTLVLVVLVGVTIFVHNLSQKKLTSVMWS